MTQTINKIAKALGVLNGELFVTSNKRLNVYTSRDGSFTLSRHIPVDDLKNPGSPASCERYQCLYISDDEEPYTVHRVDAKNNSCSKWSLSGKPSGLSVTRNNNNVLVSLFRAETIQEYTTKGQLVREIKLNDSVDYLFHSVQLTSGQFVIGHGGGVRQNRVCVVDDKGRIIKSCGGQRGEGDAQLGDPCCLSVDSEDNVLVADCLNDRLVLLTKDLSHVTTVSQLRDAAGREYQLRGPRRLHFDEQNSRL